MKRTQILAALIGVVLGSGSAAYAATSVSLTAAGPFTPGSLITLTTTVTSNGGETAATAFGAINFNDAQLNSNVAGNSQVNLSTIGDMNPGWSTNALLCTTVFCVAFNQTKALPFGTAGVTNTPIATTTFIIDPSVTPGTVITFAWRTTPSTQRLDWFGLTNAPGTSVTVAGVIPEPTTAALLGLGMLGLAVSGRRRRA
ncbi:MAG TPA: PEP-CTERM sorting domain-containing protein [Myxococcota bacterium]|nr:PEP-CTERM sorting domain-containing protein [Myxococcota bacterium]